MFKATKNELGKQLVIRSSTQYSPATETEHCQSNVCDDLPTWNSLPHHLIYNDIIVSLSQPLNFHLLVLLARTRHAFEVLC